MSDFDILDALAAYRKKEYGLMPEESSGETDEEKRKKLQNEKFDNVIKKESALPTDNETIEEVIETSSDAIDPTAKYGYFGDMTLKTNSGEEFRFNPLKTAFSIWSDTPGITGFSSFLSKEQEDDVTRSLASIPMGLADVASDFIVEPIARGVFDVDKEKYQKEYLEMQANVINALDDAFEIGASQEEKEKRRTLYNTLIDSETGLQKQQETLLGIGLDLGTYVVGGGLIFKTLNKYSKFKKRGTFTKFLIAEQGIEQLIGDKNYNMANMAKDFTDFGDPVLEYLASDKDDEALLKRAKLSLTGALTLGGLFGLGKGIKGVGDVTGATKHIRRFGSNTKMAWNMLFGKGGDVDVDYRAQQKFNKKFEELDEDQIEDLVGDILIETKKLETVSNSPLIKEIKKIGQDDDAAKAQIIKESTRRSAVIPFTPIELNPMRLVDRLKSRGHYSKKAYHAQEETIYRQRALQLKATNISKRLERSIDTIVEESGSLKIIDTVNEALTDPNISKLPEEQQLKELLKILPEDIAEEVFRARSLVDDLSKTIIDNNITNEVTRKTIESNLGQYLTRSYKLYEDPNFIPDVKQTEIVKDLLFNKKLAKYTDKDGNLTITEDSEIWKRLKIQAVKEVEDLINVKDIKEFNDYVSRVRGLHKNMFTGRKDIDIEIRKLMGEIKDPSENIRLTVNKLARITETHKFYSQLQELGGSVPLDSPMYNQALDAARKTLSKVSDEDVPKQLKVGGFVVLKGIKSDNISEGDVGKITKIVDDKVSIEVRDIDGQIKAKLSDKTYDSDELNPDSFGEGDFLLIGGNKAVRTKAETLYRDAYKNTYGEGNPYTEAQYIFKNTNSMPIKELDKYIDVFNTPIKGTGTALDGQLTTPEMARAIENLEDTVIWGQTALKNEPFFLGLGAIKGFNQNMRTTWDHTTHLRNGFGSAQWSVANGVNPFSYSDTSNFQALAKHIFQSGDDKQIAAYLERRQELGLIGTSIRGRETKELLLTASEGISTKGTKAEGFGKFFQRLENASEKYPTSNQPVYSAGGKGIRAIKAANEKAEQIYMAWDDYFKLNAFEYELASLKKIRPNASLRELEEEAAEIVKDTFQNYDRVPKALKALRQLPFGNFVSFPAEVIRTSFNILKRGSSEVKDGIATQNNELRKRGLQRLAGFSMVQGAWAAAGTGVYSQFLGIDDEQNEALQNLSEGYNLNHNLVFSYVNNQLYAMDPTYLNSFDYFQQVGKAIYRSAALGDLEGKDIDSMLFDATWAGLTEMTRPFREEAMWLTTLSQLKEAWDSDKGRTLEGRKIFETRTVDEILNKTLEELYRGFAPGVALDAEKIADAIMKKPDPRTGRPKRDKFATFLEMSSGINFRPINIENQFNIKQSKFLGATRYDVKRPVEYGSTIEKRIEHYIYDNEQKLRASHEFYNKAINPMKDLGYLSGDLIPLMQEGGFSDASERVNMYEGIFTPIRIPLRDRDSMRQKYNNTTLELEKGLIRLDKIYDYYNREIPLEPIGKTEKTIFQTRLGERQSEDESWQAYRNIFPKSPESFLQNYAEGGKINFENPVPQVPDNPSERINKMTGEPYSDTAGFEDPLKLLGFAGGGQVDPLARLGFKRTGKVFGSVVRTLAKQAATKKSRAGRNVEAYHGTLADIEEFKVQGTDLGIHVGTPEQAFRRVTDVVEDTRIGDAQFERNKQAEFIEEQITAADKLRMDKDATKETKDELKNYIKRMTKEVDELQTELSVEDFATGANILPLQVKAENPLRLRDVENWESPTRVTAELLRNPNFKNKEDKKKLSAIMREARKMEKQYTKLFGASDYKEYSKDPKALELVNEIKNFIQSKGYDSIIYQNRFESPKDALNKDSYIIFDPKDIRARSAKFDPEKADSPRLLDATGGQVLGMLKRRIPAVGGGLQKLVLLGARKAANRGGKVLGALSRATVNA
tara:strand:+ start:4110 stop:9902 length:5793 start_codon:yes stop_codon:yes gene_type:complete